jgi:hypothetical protein
VNRGNTSALLFSGTSTSTVTDDVEVVITAGVTVTLAFRARTIFSMLFALAVASAAVAPGTIAARAAS